MNARPEASADRRARRLVLAFTVWIPLAVIAIGTIVQIVWIPRMPARIATHFAADGTPNAFATPVQAVVIYAVTSLALVALLAGLTYAMSRVSKQADASSARPDARSRPLAVITLGTTIAITVVVLALTAAQLDGREPGVPFIPLAILVGYAFGGVAGWLAWLALPKPAPREAPTATPAIPVAAGERAVWTASARTSWALWLLVGVAFAAAAVPLFLDPSNGGWIVSLVLLVVVGLLATTTAIRATVDARGFAVRTAFGLPLARVPLGEVVSAAAVEVTATEFGGWGFRFDADGRRGIILRSGPAIEVERRSSPPLVVTVPDAETGAALLNGLAAR
ncbi:DUF1648 domain-containing protein [Agromyces protaetiae]|uniref:DUF1648 domain-containing protein n=1 Tax=Agromyces protaetiae TaxID=2509455 RepID=A0A4P6FFV6_9MICO|nr:DUF1648 domain-containing protein [Agromyces protaetiae]QAY74785.1 DUF1648 domain-containing protein [Agromyces protaetiae]